jgi:hypothetical protein
MSVIVSDHALIRYLERVHGIDMEFFRQCAATEAEDAAKAGARAAKIGDNWFMMDGHVLVTVLPSGKRPKSRDRREWKRIREEIDRERFYAEAQDDQSWS